MPEASSATRRAAPRPHPVARVRSSWLSGGSEGAGHAGPFARGATAFTLIELLAVLTILALLGAVMLGAGRRVSETGRVAQARTELAAIAAGLEAYQRRYGDYPRTADAGELLDSLSGRRAPDGSAIIGRACLHRACFRIGEDAGGEGSSGPTLLDPWQRSYVYVFRVPAAGWENASYVLYSRGPDGRHDRTLRPGGFADPTAAPNLDNLYPTR